MFWLALVCMKYYQNIAHFSFLQPLTQEIWSHRGCDWQVSVFNVPLRIAALFWSYSKNSDRRRNECVICIKALLLCLTPVCHYFWAVLLCVTSLFVTYSVGVKRTLRISEFKLISEFSPWITRRLSRVASSSLWILCVLWERNRWVHSTQCLGGGGILNGRGQRYGQEFHPAANILPHIIHSYL